MNPKVKSEIQKYVRSVLKVATFPMGICGVISLFGGVAWASYIIFTSWGMWGYLAAVLSGFMGLWAELGVFLMFRDRLEFSKADSPSTS